MYVYMYVYIHVCSNNNSNKQHTYNINKSNDFRAVSFWTLRYESEAGASLQDTSVPELVSVLRSLKRCSSERRDALFFGGSLDLWNAGTPRVVEALLELASSSAPISCDPFFAPRTARSAFEAVGARACDEAHRQAQHEKRDALFEH